MNVSDTIRYIGVNDRDIDLFEGQYAVSNGMAYNSYVIMDEKIAVMDTVDKGFTEEWLGNLSAVLDGRTPDYLVVQHMEPDHSAGITAFMRTYPQATAVASGRAFQMMTNFFGTDYADRRMIVGENDTLSLGEHTLTFITAPMVHWPEVIVTYESREKVLFSADAFGKFGTTDADEDWACEARRYYFGIIGKYGAQVQALLKKVSALDIRTICPLHGPVLRDDLDTRLGLYAAWSSYAAEDEGVVIAYTSVYGHTKEAVKRLADRLRGHGCRKVSVIDLARSDMAEAVEDAFRYDRLVLATTTYNADIFPFMREFIRHLTERGYQNRTVGLIENGSWAPTAAKTMRELLEPCKNLTFTDTTVKIFSALNKESIGQIDALADELAGRAR